MTQSTVAISRSAEPDAERRSFEDVLAEALAGAVGGDAIIIPHVYYLTGDHPAVSRLAAVQGPLVIGAWLHPRATEWVLRSLGIGGSPTGDQGPGPPRIRAIDLRKHASAEECVRAIEGLVGTATSEALDTGSAVPDEITDAVASRWYPVIDYSRCGNCKQCLEFCLFGVYSLDDGGQVVASSPDNCKPGCPACARVCPNGAIMFPHYDADVAIAGGTGEASSEPEVAEAGDSDDLDELIDTLEQMEL